MNHGVAIGANNSEVNEFCFARLCSVTKRLEVMHLCVISSKLAIDNFKIKMTFWHFTL